MYRLIACGLAACLGSSLGLAGCKAEPSAAEIADRGWHAHDLVISAGEAAKSCADAAVAMRQVFDAHRADFVAAFQLDQDKARLQEATDFLEAHRARYADLETRMGALTDRCANDAAVQGVFREMATP